MLCGDLSHREVTHLGTCPVGPSRHEFWSLAPLSVSTGTGPVVWETLPGVGDGTGRLSLGFIEVGGREEGVNRWFVTTCLEKRQPPLVPRIAGVM